MQSSEPSPATPRQPVVNIPPVTLMLLLLLVVWHLVRTFVLTPDTDDIWVFKLAFIPLRFRETALHDAAAWWPLVSYAILHFGWAHLAMNMAGLAAFGSAVERSLGAVRYIGILLSGIIGGALLHLLLFSGSVVLLGGISAGLSGLFAVTLAIIQHARGATRWRALLAPALMWLAVNLVFGLLGMPTAGEHSVVAIAWIAHVGGFFAGLLWLPLLWPHYRFKQTTGDAV